MLPTILLLLSSATAAGAVCVDEAAATLPVLDEAIATLQAARARNFPTAPAPPKPMCGWEKPVDSQCIDPCPACLGYPYGVPGCKLIARYCTNVQ